MLSGAEMWCQLFSEPAAGSDLAGLRTSASPTGDCWVLDGQKVWSSYAQLSDFGVCIARTDPSVPKHAGLSALIVDIHAAGVDVRPIRQITGATEFCEVFLSEVVLDQGTLLGRPGDGWKVALSVLGFERMQIAARLRPLLAGHADRAIAIARAAHLNVSADVRQELVDLVISERILGWVANRVEADLADGRLPGAESSILKLALRGHRAGSEVPLKVLKVRFVHSARGSPERDLRGVGAPMSSPHLSAAAVQRSYSSPAPQFH